jgi:hypothetical protein
MSLKWPNKDPDDVLDFQIDWSARLGTDTISTSTWTLNSGSVVLGTDTKTATTATIWLSGGTLGDWCELDNTIVTAGGRTLEQLVKIKIAEV